MILLDTPLNGKPVQDCLSSGLFTVSHLPLSEATQYNYSLSGAVSFNSKSAYCPQLFDLNHSKQIIIELHGN